MNPSSLDGGWSRTGCPSQTGSTRHYHPALL